MKMTEKEAAGKWCPQSRIGQNTARHDEHEQLPAFNRQWLDHEEPPSVFKNQPYPETCCLGSSCAMWRWADSPSCRRIHLCDQMHATTEPERPSSMPTSWVFEPWAPAHPDGWAQWIEPEDEAHARRRGYCGLAGKPEGH